ncbi:MAG: glycoside hydrolase family 43 protein [Flavobacteriaceae bacterium]|nr:glycoside hydrolase family 43 protein [Flavobacteriaceae bacterium]
MKNYKFLILVFCINLFSNTNIFAQFSAPDDDFIAKKVKSQAGFLNTPLVSEIYTADPSAHLFEGRIYIYGSHDIESTVIDDDCGSQYSMRDYRVLSMDEVGGAVTVHKVALDLKDVPWATRQFWAPDAAYKNGKYFLYFPSKDKDDRFRIGVAVSDKPQGPFIAEPDFIPGSYSIDPAVFTDDDGSSYMYFGGIWGGQLQRWENNTYEPSDCKKQDRQNPEAPAILPRIAKMSEDMLSFSEEVKEVMILDEKGNPILTKDHDRRFFEAAWIHKYKGIYYLSYSTGNTHFLQYATAENPYGPFTYKGVMNQPVKGWTNHHSVMEIKGQWYLFYHDIQLSNQTNLRNIKMTELFHNEDGSIQTINTLLK